MRKQYSIVVKTVAVCLFAITVTAAALGAGASLYMLDDGYFDIAPVSFAGSGLCYRQAHKSSEKVMYEYVTAYMENPDSGAVRTYEEHFDPANTNYAFRVSYHNGEELLNTYTENDSYEFVASYTYSLNDEYYMVESYVDPSLPVKTDAFYAAFRLYQGLMKWRYVIPVAAGAGGLLALASFIYLMCAAGHRRDTDASVITLTWYDRIPLDLDAAASLLASVAVAGFATNFDMYSETLIITISLVMLLISLLALAVFVSFSARVKKGEWYKNTVTYMALRLMWRIAKAVFEVIGEILKNLPAVWKTVLFWGTLCFINMICQIAGGFGAFFWWFVVNAAVGVLGCIVTIWMRDLQKGGEAIAHGDINHHIDTSKMRGDFKCHGEALNNISVGMGRAVEERIRSEHFKTELITNVSHDLKTPLTSIISYVDLLKKTDITDPQALEYIDVLDRQSARLKKLTEDLVEASKASSGTITAEPSRTNVVELLSQALSEYTERLEAAGVEAVIHAPSGEAAVYADGRLLWRVFDNLLGNICKYSQRGTRAYIDVADSGDKVAIIFKNISNYQLNISADELMERFVRGDTSRHTEGSGLGLSIARSLTELQGGSFSLIVDGDLFKALITFDKMADQPSERAEERENKTMEQPALPALNEE